MTKLLVVFAIPCALLCAADQTPTTPTATRPTVNKPAVVPKVTAKSKTSSKTPVKPAAVSKPAPPLTIPAGAVEVEPFLYRHQDADGKKWLYRQTPFGVVKMEDKPQAAVVPTDDGNPVKVMDEGETVKFEKKTPFGVQTWSRKKAELSDEEKAFMQNSAGSGSTRNTGKQ